MKVSTMSVGLLALAFSLSCVATAASATPHVFEGDIETTKVCAQPHGTIKVESPTGEQLVVVAPDGYEIDKICVKAGSDKQGDGVSWIYGNGRTTITVSHPSGKDVSHFVAYFKPKVVTPPEEEEPNDGENPPVNWIVDWPEFPTVCKGVPSIPASTQQVSYASYGDFIAIYPQEGWSYVQDFVNPGMTYIELPVASLEEVCPDEPVDEEPPVEENPVEEEPSVVVTPPETDTPPAVDVPPATDVPPAAVVPPAQNATPVIDAAIVPASAHVEPVADVEQQPAADVDQASSAMPNNLADTGFEWLYVAIGALGALALIAGAFVIGFKNRLFPIKE